MDSPGVHTGLVHSTDVLLGFNPANEHTKVISGRCGAAETGD